MEERFIQVSDYSSYVGNAILAKVEADVIKIRTENPKVPIILDFKNTSFQDTYMEKLASICAYHDCQVFNLGGREAQLMQVLQRGYFEFQHMGREKYLNRFKELVERTDYPLLIWDKRARKSTLDTQLSIIRPLYFTQHKFIFHEMRGQFTQPKMLKRAIDEGRTEDIFVRNEVFLNDIDNTTLCFRFAATKRERIILDLLDGLLNNQYSWLMGGEYREG